MHEIVLNGESRSVAEGSTVLSLLGELGIPAQRVAVELDRVILKPATWGETRLRPGAKVEIVHFVGGGRR
ncbi:MAG: thiamine biosynthesis protein ThiS [Acidobacteriia bacterium 12-62-4]|nr:MAG: thiamine biosynthesis protein ThiS [Acidobacteriia bacterium 12-62-4]